MAKQVRYAEPTLQYRIQNPKSKEGKHMKKRILSIILSFVMLLSLLPTTALAEEPDSQVPSCTCGVEADETGAVTHAAQCALYQEQDSGEDNHDAEPQCSCGASADADGVISHLSDCLLYTAVVNEPEAADPECTCGAVPNEDGLTAHGEDCPLYTEPEVEPEERPEKELAAPAVLERPFDEETSSDTVLYVDGQWDAYCWEIYTDDTFEWTIYADTAEIVVDKETYVASAFRCTVTLGDQSAVTEPAAYNTELIEPTVSLWNTRSTSGSSEYMTWSKSDSAFNVHGLDGDYEFQTTYVDRGYLSRIEVDGVSREGTGGQLRDGLTYDITPSLVYDGRYVKITYTVENTGSKTYAFHIGSFADVMIDENDRAPIVGLTGGGGLVMSGSPRNDYTFNLVAPSADTLWYGFWWNAGDNVFNDRADKTSVYEQDSGMAWSWKDEVIKPGQTWERSVLIGVGELPLATNMPSIPSMPEFVAGENGTISGTATPGDTVYVTVDGEEYSAAADTNGNFSMDVPVPAEQPDNILDVTYYAVSPEGGISAITSVQANVATAPRITLKQSELTLIEEDTAPDFNSYIADSDGNVSIASAAVNTDIPGTYTVTYTASVSGFNPVTADLTVTVVPKPAELTAASCTDGSASFDLTATMNYTGGHTYTETGFVYAPYHYPTLTDCAGMVVTSSPVNTKGGPLSASVADSALTYGVSYYARPYAKFGNTVIYGGESGNFGLGVPSYGSVRIINNGNNTFTVSRTDGSDGEQIVHYRTVNGSAVGGTHFTHQTGTVTIPDGATAASTTISIVELGVEQTYGGKAATGYSNADRTYEVEIYLVEGGAAIGTDKASRTMTKNSGYVICRTIYSEWKTQTKSDEVYRGDYDKDGLGWTENAQGSAAQETFKIADTPGFSQRDYWMNTADAIMFQLQFTAREADGGYQHIQITPGQSLDLKIHPESGDWKGTRSTTLYVATFEHGGNGAADKDYATYYFPKASGNNKYTPSETFYGTQDSDQYVRLPATTEYVSVGYTGSGTSGDEWLTKDQYNKFMLKDTKEPQLLGIAPMADTTYVPGQKMTLALIFDEIVDQTNSASAGLNSSTVLYVDWTGDNNADAQFNYAGGLDTNVLYFTCTLPETTNVTGAYTLNLLSNSDLSTKIKDMCDDSGSSSAGYAGKTVAVKFDSTKPTVNVSTLSTDEAGFTSGTIAGSNFTRLEYVWSQDSTPPMAGWERVADSGTAVKTRQTEGTWYLHARATNAYGRAATDTAAITFAADGSGGTPVVLPELEVTVDNTNWVKAQREIGITRQPNTAAVTVTRPDGIEETVSGNTFTATTNGIYTFTLTSGSETITRTVNVARIDFNAPSVVIEDLTNFTHTAAVTLTVTAADTESGLAATPLSGVWKNGTQEVAAEFAIAGDGVWTTTSPDQTGSWELTVTATDAVGHTCSDTSATYTIHADRPTITISNHQETNAGITYDYAVQEKGNEDVTVTLPDGTTTTALTGTVLLTEPGSYYIFVTDALGHYVQSAEMTVPQSTPENPVDYTAPDVRYDTAPYTWTNVDAVTVTLYIFEEQGLASVTWRKYGETTETVIDLSEVSADEDGTYTTGFTVTENGTYTVTASDSKENSSTVDIVVDFIDRTAPEVGFDGTFEHWMNSEQTITLQPADPDMDGDNVDASGVAEVEYAVSANNTAVSAELTVLQAPYQVTISENGTWYIYYKVTDMAGNVATGWSSAVKVDKVTPAITVDTGNAMDGAAEQTVSVTATFGVSGGTVMVGGDTVLVMESTAQSGTYTENETDTYVLRAKGIYDFVATGGAGKTASQTVTVYGIDFDSNGGTEVADQIVVSGGKATAPETITRTGYNFKEWQATGTAYAFADTAVTADISLKAVWTLDAPAVSVTSSHESIVYGTGFTLTATPGHAANDVTYSYQWYKGEDAVAGATERVLNLTNVSESGSYTVKVTATNQDSPALVSPTVESDAVTVNIEPKPVDEPTVNGTYAYTGSEQTVVLNGYDNRYMTIAGNNKATEAGSYEVIISLDNNHKWSGDSDGRIAWSISAKEVTPTAALEYASIVYDGSERKPTVTLKGEDRDIPSSEYTVVYSNNVNVGSAAVTITDKEGGNYAFAEITKTFEIMKEGVSPVLTMADYVYGSAPAIPGVGGNTSGGTVTVYYSTDSSKVDKLWEDISGTTLNVGTYYMKAHVAATDNYAEGVSPVITFKVTPGKYAAPSAPTADEFTVTINEADRGKKLEYSLDGTNWSNVPTLIDGAFELKGLAESTQYTIYLRVKASADGNYQASDAVGAVWTTPARYSVAYHANLGTGNVPASVTQNSGRSVTVAHGSGLKRTGYTFAGWNTAADGTGTDYAPGSAISTGATLYAKWTANSYTVKFKANGGNGTMVDQSFTYDEAQALTENAFTRDGYHFAGWSLASGNTAIYMDGQTVKNLSNKGTVTLYAVWVEDVYKIGADFFSDSNHEISAKLMRGDTQIGSTQSVTMSGSNAPYTGHFDFTGVPKGVYNIVAEQDGKVMTKLIIITDHDDTVKITMPDSRVNSVLEVSEDALPVVVGGLEAEAVTKAEESKTVTITMTVEKQEEQQFPESAPESEKATQEAIAEIKEKASDKNLEFMDIEVKKTVVEAGQADVSEKLSETNKVMEIVIPFDLTGKKDVAVYRHHNGQTEQFTENTSKTDGTFYIDELNHLIHVFSQKFSTYAIGYTVPTSSSGGYIPTYAITVEKSEHGTIKTNRGYAPSGSTVTITVTPEDGYVLRELSVADSQDNKIEVTDMGNGTYTFKMPHQKVTVEASFAAVGSFSACPKDTACPIWPFIDAETTAWYHDGVHFCIENGLMAGYGNGVFKPNADTTRAMITVMLWRLNGSPVVSYLLDFEDVEEGKWYTEAIRWAKSKGIAVGYGNGYFGTNDAVTREQMVTILWRYAQHMDIDVSVGEDTNILSYNDAFYVSEYAIPAMQWACGSGMVQGMTDPNGEGMILAPESKGTRAQIATMMMRFCENIVK